MFRGGNWTLSPVCLENFADVLRAVWHGAGKKQFIVTENLIRWR